MKKTRLYAVLGVLLLVPLLWASVADACFECGDRQFYNIEAKAKAKAIAITGSSNAQLDAEINTGDTNVNVGPSITRISTGGTRVGPSTVSTGNVGNVDVRGVQTTVNTPRDFLQVPGLIDTPIPLDPWMADTANGTIFESILFHSVRAKGHSVLQMNVLAEKDDKRAVDLDLSLQNLEAVSRVHITNNLGKIPELAWYAGQASILANDRNFTRKMYALGAKSGENGVDVLVVEVAAIPEKVALGLALGGSAASSLIDSSNPYAYAGTVGGGTGYHKGKTKMTYLINAACYTVEFDIEVPGETDLLNEEGEFIHHSPDEVE
jgi:hypothetical protein